MTAAVQPFLFPATDSPWIPIRDGDATARAIFHRHYSRYVYGDGRKPAKIIGPGEYMLLITQDALALFAWRKFRSADNQTGINCAIFRNEGTSAGRSSDLIRAAMELCLVRWPEENRMYTYVNARKVRHKRDPGRCFLKAGWRQCGVTKSRKLLVFEAFHTLQSAVHAIDQLNDA